jgi:hypothetical protein
MDVECVHRALAARDLEDRQTASVSSVEAITRPWVLTNQISRSFPVALIGVRTSV